MLITCIKCSEEKLMTEFCFSNRDGGYTNLCKKCKLKTSNSESLKVRKAAGVDPYYKRFKINP